MGVGLRWGGGLVINLKMKGGGSGGGR